MMALRHLWALTIWAKGAIPSSEWKYRNLKRVWLPVYDGIAIVAGICAIEFGSRLLFRIFPGSLVDGVAALYAVVAFVCLVGVSFPRLWAVEVAGKVALVGLIVGYIAAIVFYSSNPPGEPPSWFIVSMLAGLLPMPLFRLSLLGEEWVTRLIKRRRARERIA